MLKADVIKHFGSQGATARALGLTKGAISQWPRIVPRGSAYQIEVVTHGKLRVDPDVYAVKAKSDVTRVADSAA